MVPAHRRSRQRYQLSSVKWGVRIVIELPVCGRLLDADHIMGQYSHDHVCVSADRPVTPSRAMTTGREWHLRHTQTNRFVGQRAFVTANLD